MAAALQPIFTRTPFAAIAQIATANTARDGTGTIGTVKSAGANGSRIHRVTITATVATTAGVIRLFLHDGTNFRLFEEILVAAVTPSATVLTSMLSSALITAQNPLVIPSGYSLRASTHNSETFNVVAHGGDY